MSEEKIYISPEEWARVLAETWLDAEFKVAVETNPGVAIPARFPDIKFQRVYEVAPRDEDISDETLARVVSGEETAFPDVQGPTHAMDD